jgi:hypothetical protein
MKYNLHNLEVKNKNNCFSRLTKVKKRLSKKIKSDYFAQAAQNKCFGYKKCE